MFRMFLVNTLKQFQNSKRVAKFGTPYAGHIRRAVFNFDDSLFQTSDHSVLTLRTQTGLSKPYIGDRR